jgi:hypothetical protein
MRFMLVHRLDAAYDPDERFRAGMGRLIQDMTKAGVLLTAEELLPWAEGVRVSFRAGRRTVTEGPCTETTGTTSAERVIAGFALIQVRSKAEAIEWAARFAAVIGGLEMEVRQVAPAPGARAGAAAPERPREEVDPPGTTPAA